MLARETTSWQGNWSNPQLFDDKLYMRQVAHSQRLREGTCYGICGIDGYILATCDFGYLRVHDIDKAVQSSSTLGDGRPPSWTIDVGYAPLLSIAKCTIDHRTLVLCGGQQAVHGYTSSTLLEASPDTHTYPPDFTIPCAQFSRLAAVQSFPVDCNMISVDEQSREAYVACGSGLVCVCDLTTLQPKRVLEGHTNYVHCVSVHGSTGLAFSGDEDGNVCIWDAREKSSRPTIGLSLKPKLGSRCGILPEKDCSLFVGGVALDESANFLVAVGGADTTQGTLTKCSGWACYIHLGSREIVSAVNTPTAQHTFAFADDNQIVTGGISAQVSHWSCPALALSCKTAVTPQAVFAVAQVQSRSNPQQNVMAVGGSSPYVDMFISRGIKAASVLPAMPL